MSSQNQNATTITKLVQDVLLKGDPAINVSQQFIVTTEDKVRLCLGKHLAAIEAKKAWLVPTGILLAVVATLTAADFHEALGLPKEVWHALFLLILIGALGWLVWAVVAAWGSKSTVETLIAEMSGNGVSVSEAPPTEAPSAASPDNSQGGQGKRVVRAIRQR